MHTIRTLVFLAFLCLGPYMVVVYFPQSIQVVKIGFVLGLLITGKAIYTIVRAYTRSG